MPNAVSSSTSMNRGGGSGRKRCMKGKSCGITCISKSYLCVMHLHPDIVAQLRYARIRVRAMHGNKDIRTKAGHDQLHHRSGIDEIVKLSREYKKLPEGSKRRAEIKRRIYQLEHQRGSTRGYDRSYYD